LKLLIDEMYPPAIAEQLRERDRDAGAVTERPELRALTDADLFARAQTEQRAVLTEDVADLSVIVDGYDLRGQPHFGLILIPSRAYPRARPATIGRMVTALDKLLGKHPDETATSLRCWL
jgi:hypothetical protein